MSYRREDIKNAIWDDEDFDALSDEAALLYLWSFTNPRCGMAGVYRVKRRDICEGRFSDRRDKALDELRASRHLYYVDQYIWVRTRVKHIRQKGKPILASVKKDVLQLPQGHPFREAFCTEYRPQWKALVTEIEEGFVDQAVEQYQRPPDGFIMPPQGAQSDGFVEPETADDPMDSSFLDDMADSSRLSEPPEGARVSVPVPVRGRGSETT